MKRSDVASFVEDASDAIAASEDLGKRNTELRVVEPFLSTLGWDVRSSSVTAAYAAANDALVDYALCPDGRVGAFVAVEACGAALSAERRDALLAAMHAEGVDRGVYTNGRQYLLLAVGSASDPGRSSAGDSGRSSAGDSGSSSAGDSGDVERVRMTLESLPEHVDALSALTYDGVAAASTDVRAVAAALASADEAAVDRVTRAVADVADDHGEISAQATARAVRPLTRRFLAGVVDEFTSEGVDADASSPERDGAQTAPEGGQQLPEAGDGAADSSKHRGGSSQRAADPSHQAGVSTLAGASDAAGAESDGEFVLRFFEDGRSVGAVGSSSVAVAVAQGVQYLLTERGLAPRIELPYAPVEDRVAFLARDPKHPDGRAMGSAIDLDGVYVETGADVATLRESIEALAGRGGLRVMFAGDWPDTE
ncbi:hypothetical protein G9C85_00290 [Halorubellus sp. JP-L1]|uniref:hypothetical protein n=1 Tax=Halorubellus sp. JP-L1 TaxID=2715753 RepID=UPI00140D68F6|nr:hypothetical protein [Halorubellus sp. JP-L1]NHN40077.1 hypothetical protein [Halorubellus sp. JP-L1]